MLVSDISKVGRVASGVKLIRLDSDKDIDVVAIAKVRETPEQINETVAEGVEELDDIDDEILDEELLDDEIIEDEILDEEDDFSDEEILEDELSDTESQEESNN